MKDFKEIFKYTDKVNLIYGIDSLTVNEVLKLPIFKDCEVIAGSLGLENRCKHITILETPDGINWLEGEEFLLTTGYALYNNKQAKNNIILEAFNKGVSAIGIKDNRYFGEINWKLIDDANKYNIPIIKMSYNIIYTETISGFYDLLFYRKNQYILKLNNIYEKLLNLTFENKDINGIANSLSNLLNANIFIFDVNDNIISRNIVDTNTYKIIMDFLPFNRKGKNIFEDRNKTILNYNTNGIVISWFPIVRDDKGIAFLCLIKNVKLDLLEQSVIEYGLSIISMKLEKKMLIKLGRKKLNKTLVEMMLNNKNLPKEFFMNVEKDLGWNMKGGIAGVCIKINIEGCLDYLSNKELIYKQVDDCLGPDNYLTTNKDNEVFIFFKLQDDNYLKNIVNTMSASISRVTVKASISIGVSNIYNSLSEIERIYDESYLAALFCNNNIKYYYLLDTTKLLYPLKNDKEINIYYKNTIQKIIDYDKEHDMDLLDTLKTYFRYNMNKKNTSIKLFIHVETLRYRLSRIEDITGYDTSDIEGIFALKMGLKLKTIMDLK